MVINIDKHKSISDTSKSLKTTSRHQRQERINDHQETNNINTESTTPSNNPSHNEPTQQPIQRQLIQQEIILKQLVQQLHRHHTHDAYRQQQRLTTPPSPRQCTKQLV
jgi:hypothetical protein